ncbi:hypothetical protein VYU27_007440 [Nannochloropsis oceanica]
MLALRRRAVALTTTTIVNSSSSSGSSCSLARALSTKPPSFSRHPPPHPNAKARPLGDLKKTAPPPTGTGAPPPPSGGPVPPTPHEPSGGLGLGTAIGMVILAGGTAVTGYYYVLADEKEKAQIEGYVAEAKAMVGLASSATTAAGADAAVETAAAAEKTKVKVEKVVHDVEEGTARASENVKAKIREASTTATNAFHDVEDKASANVHGSNGDERKRKKTEVEAEGPAAKENGGMAAAEKQAKGALSTAKGITAHAAVENAEKLADQIMADIHERTNHKKEEEAAATAAAAATAEEASPKESSSIGKLQTDAALKHFATYEDRGKDLRFDSLTRAAEEALAQGEALRKHLEVTLLKDLSSLSTEALQHRVFQLVGELQERTKWEALRLHEAVRKAEVEVSGKYVELIAKLREESMEEVGRQARALDAEKQLAVQQVLDEKEKECKLLLEQEMASFIADATKAFEEERARDRAEIEGKAKRDLENAMYEKETAHQSLVAGRMEELDKLKAQVEALDEVFKTDTDYEHLSWKVHKVSAALLAFELALQTSLPLKKELSALKNVTKGDPVMDAVLSSLPPALDDGVFTLSELQVRFPIVQSAAREAAFVPASSPGMLGHMFGSVLAAITIKPRGLVEGAGADEVLSRAAYHVERGNLAGAVGELESMEGLVGRAVTSWVVDAKGRLVMEQAVRAMNARSAVLNASMV